MKRMPVVSSNVSEIGYDPQTETLEVAFKHGGVYQYFGVPAAIYYELVAAPSIGRYLEVNVKKADYRFRKVAV